MKRPKDKTAANASCTLHEMHTISAPRVSRCQSRPVSLQATPAGKKSVRAKLALGTLLAAAITTLTFETIASSSVEAVVACKRNKFDTTMVAAACKAGGQKTAKDEMTSWVRAAKKRKPDLSCQTCHTKVAGDYPVKPTALRLYKDLGGQ